jgi:hypothetical protein
MGVPPEHEPPEGSHVSVWLPCMATPTTQQKAPGSQVAGLPFMGHRTEGPVGGGSSTGVTSTGSLESSVATASTGVPESNTPDPESSVVTPLLLPLPPPLPLPESTVWPKSIDWAPPHADTMMIAGASATATMEESVLRCMGGLLRGK